MLGAIWAAKTINQVLGGAFVAPWDLQELPDVWTDAILGMAVEVPALARGKALVEEAKERWRKKVNRR